MAPDQIAYRNLCTTSRGLLGRAALRATKTLDQAADLLSEGLDRRSGDYRRLVLRLWEC
jgi:hypothetical protein